MATYTSGTSSTSFQPFITGPGQLATQFYPSSNFSGGVASPDGNTYYYISNIAGQAKGYDGTSNISMFVSTSSTGGGDSTGSVSATTASFVSTGGAVQFVARNGLTYFGGYSTGSQGGIQSTRSSSSSSYDVIASGSVSFASAQVYYVLTYFPMPNTSGTVSVTGISSSGATASWNSTSGATGYIVQYNTSQSATGATSLDVGNTTSTPLSLSASTSYFVRHRAYSAAYSVNSAATGPWSAWQPFSTPSAVSAPTVSDSFLANGTRNVSYFDSVSINSSGSNNSITCSNNPSWNGFGATQSGTTWNLSGTPDTAGSFTLNFTGTNEGGSVNWSSSFTINQPANPSWDNVGDFANGKVNQSYYQTRTASNSTSISSAFTNAPGLSATTSGTNTLVLSGTPTASGTYSVSATANGQAGTTAANLSVNVYIAPLQPPVWVDQNVSTIFTVGTPYSDSVSASNATSYTINGTVPNGISLNSSGSLFGTPTTKQSFNFTISASNTDGTITTGSFSGTTTAPPVWTDQTLGAFSQGRVYSDAVSATSPISSSPTAYAVTAGSLPTGITLNTATGAVTGTPTGTGNFSFTITASNTDGSTSASFSGTIKLPPNWTDNQLGSFVETIEYFDSVLATNSPTYQVSAGALPTGISLNTSTGAVTGTPTTVNQAYSFTIRAFNADGEVTQSFSGTVQPDLGGGIKLLESGVWNNKEIYVYDANTWKQGRVYTFNGNIWVKSLF